MTYGGTAIQPDEGTTNTFTLPTGDKLVVTPDASASVTNVADSAEDNNTFTYTLENADSYTEVQTVYGDLSITPMPVTVTLTGHTGEYTYDGTEKTVTGYDVEISEPSYTNENFDYTGTSEAKGTYVGEYPMELQQDKLTNNNPNYEVTFVVVPGKLTITGEPIEPEKTTPEVNDAYELGDVIPFQITVKNVSDKTAANITVVDENAELQVGNGYTLVEGAAVIAELAPGASVIIDALHTVVVDDILAGEVINVARVTYGDKEYEVTASTDMIEDVEVELDVTKTSDKDGQKVAAGEMITYTITVENKSNVTVYNVHVDDDKTGLHEVIASMEPGAVESFMTTWIVREEEAVTGFVFNRASAEGDEIIDPKNPDEPLIPSDQDTTIDETVAYPHTVTVNYYELMVGGAQIAPSVIGTYNPDEEFCIVSPVIPGYSVDIEVVFGIMGEEDLVFNVIYTPEIYQLTINYVDVTGVVVAPQYQQQLAAGEEYHRISPEVSDLFCTMEVVEGVMPSCDVVVTVIYLPASGTVVVEEPDVPATAGMGPIGMNAGDCFE